MRSVIAMVAAEVQRGIRDCAGRPAELLARAARAADLP
jgi:hypothetical protein